MYVSVFFVALLEVVSGAPTPNDFKTAFKYNPHIVGGGEAIPHSITYQVYLEISSSYGGRSCSGALITPNYVVTAAICLELADEIHLTLGAHRPRQTEDTQLRLTSTNYKLHENYNIIDVADNIGVIKLPQSVQWTPAIQPIKLPPNDGDDYSGALATASGWGMTQPDLQIIPEALNSVQLPVITNKACQIYYGSAVTPSVLCTLSEKAGICNGDSGDPLVVDGVLIGVSSFTSVVCNGIPSGFTRITSYLDWLKANTDV